MQTSTSHTATDGSLSISVIDSHTGGEPTRVIMSGFPSLAGHSLAEMRDDLVANHFDLATLIVNEPRGNEAMVAALLCEPFDPRCATGVIFFDRSAALGMCGHGTIGLVETLRFLGNTDEREIHLETPVGVVTAVINDDGSVSIASVPSRRLATDVVVEIPDVGVVVGDVAWGGNTFFIAHTPQFDLNRPIRELLGVAEAIKRAAHDSGHVAVDHVELFGAPSGDGFDARNFVLCPSGTYDRSPCGTGTSAKVACLAADGKLAEGVDWVQESITGSRFTARYTWRDRKAGIVDPVITGTAYVMSRGELLISDSERR